MTDEQKNDRSPGKIMTLKLPITVGLLLFVGAIVLTYFFATQLSWRPEIEFFGAAIGVAAGILSAYYVGRGLSVTIEQRNRSLTTEKISKAFELAQRWNEPNFAKLRGEWRALLSEIDGKEESEVCKLLDNDHGRRTVAIDVLNYFEEVAYAARSGVADLETLKNVHRSITIHYYSAISPWIDKRRRDRHQPTAYEHFEWLKEQWK